MKRNLLLIFFLCFYIHTFGQTDSIIIFVDSINNTSIINTSTYSKKRIATRNNGNSKDIKSREGKLIASYNDNYFMTEGVEHCLKIAMNSWERYLNITNPIRFDVTINENLPLDIEIKTEVRLYQDRTDRIAYPRSLYNQINDDNRIVGTIDINAYIDWDATWIYDLDPSGSDNLTTALMRHIAHLLGFGTSIVKRAGGLGFAIRNFATPFDQLISNGNTNLSTLVRANASVIEDFMKSHLFIDLENADYPLFSSSDCFIEHRTGCYFSLGTTNFMNYPITNKSELMGINKETLEVLESIGWTIRQHNVSIIGTEIDPVGYGSMYIPHVFSAYNENGDITDNISWDLQLYRDSVYETIQTFNSSCFTLQSDMISAGQFDEFGCLECRVVANVLENGINKQYSLPLSLEARPYLLDLSIQNIADMTNPNYYKFDAYLSYKGATSGYLTVSNDYGTSNLYNVNLPDEMIINVTNVLKTGQTCIDLALENEHGTTIKRMYFDYINNTSDTKIRYEQQTPKTLINGIATDNCLLLRDNDVCFLEVSDNTYIEDGKTKEDYTFKWNMCLENTNGNIWSESLSDISTGTSLKFTITPILFNRIIPFENYSKTDENGIVYHDGYIDCNIYDRKTGNLVKIFRRHFRLEVLPRVPLFRILEYYIADSDTDWPYPMLKFEFAHNGKLAYLVIDQNEPNIGEVDQLITDSIQETPIIIETEGLTLNDSYRVDSWNPYGYSSTDWVSLTPSSIGELLDDINIFISNGICYIRENSNMLSVKIIGLDGRKYYNDNQQTASVRLPQGIYIVNISDGNNKNKNIKIIVK